MRARAAMGLEAAFGRFNEVTGITGSPVVPTRMTLHPAYPILQSGYRYRPFTTGHEWTRLPENH